MHPLRRQQQRDGRYVQLAQVRYTCFVRPTRYQFSEARSRLSDLVDRASRGEAVAIVRRGSEPVVLSGGVDFERLLASQFPFRTEVMFGDASVSLWLPELDLYGHGHDLDAAVGDLAMQAVEYVTDWEDGLRHAPNHAHRWGWVQRVRLTNGDLSTLAALLLEEPPD